MPGRKPTFKQRFRIFGGRVASFMLLDEIWRRRGVLSGLLSRDFKVRYAGTALGTLWSVLRPLLILGAYYFAFGIVLGARTGGEGDAGYAVYLLSGLIPWFAFIEAATIGSKSLTSGMGLVRKVRLPFEMLTFKAVFQPAMVYAPFILLLWIFVSGMNTAWHVFYLVFWFLLQVLLTYYLVHTIAILTAVMRDIGEIFNVVVGRLIFISPVLFPLSRVPESFVGIMYLNPMTPFVNGYHRLVLEGELPEPVDVFFVAGWVVVFAASAMLLHRRVQHDLVDWA